MSVDLLREAAKVMRREVEFLPALIDDAADGTDRVPVEMGEALRRHLRQLVAVADWLEAEADHHAKRDEFVAAATANDEWVVRLEASTLPQAVAVARAYLGGAS